LDWLEGERDSSWRCIATIRKNTDMEISEESCCEAIGMTWCIIRMNQGEGGIHYMACCIPPDQESEIAVPVSRTEMPSGEVIEQDNWDKDFKRVLKVSKLPYFSKVITVARNFSGFNNYSTPPPFVLQISLVSFPDETPISKGNKEKVKPKKVKPKIESEISDGFAAFYIGMILLLLVSLIIWG